MTVGLGVNGGGPIGPLIAGYPPAVGIKFGTVVLNPGGTPGLVPSTYETLVPLTTGRGIAPWHWCR